MKKYLILSLIFLSCFTAKAQPWSTQYAYVLALTNSSITNSTVPILKTVDGAVRDTTLGLMNYLFGLITTANSLQAVTAVGNSTTTDIYSGTGTNATPGTGTQIKAGSALWLWNSGVNIAGLENFGGLPFLYLKDQNSSFQANLISGALTADRVMLAPNEGSLSGGIGSTIVLHKTQFPDTIGDPSVLGTTINKNGLFSWEIGIPCMYIGADGSGSFEAILNNSMHNSTTTLKSDTGSGTWNQWFPHGSGTLQLSNQDSLQHVLLTGNRFINPLNIRWGAGIGSGTDAQKYPNYLGSSGNATSAGELFLTDSSRHGNYLLFWSDSGYSSNISARNGYFNKNAANAALAYMEIGDSIQQVLYGDLQGVRGQNILAQYKVNAPSGYNAEVDVIAEYPSASQVGRDTLPKYGGMVLTENDTVNGIGTHGYKVLTKPYADAHYTAITALFPHSIFTPTTGTTVSILNNTYNIINPSGMLLALTINLPSSPANNSVVYVKYTQAVTTVTYTGGTVVDGITSPISGGLLLLTYDSATTSWY